MRKTNQGILLAIVSSALFAAMHVTVRYLSSELHAFEIAFFRNVFGLLVMLPWLVHYGRRSLQTNARHWHISRGLINSVSMLCWYLSLQLLPVADATAINMTGPLFVTLGAWFFLKETVTWQRWLGIGMIMAGGLVIIRPGFHIAGPGVWLALSSTILFSFSKLISKRLTRTDSTRTIVAYVTMLMIPPTFVAALFVWQWPTLMQLIWLLIIGTLGTLAHLCMTRAYSHLDIALADPFIVARLIWATMFGFMIFQEYPDLWTSIGATVIATGLLYIFLQGRRVKKSSSM
jgi:drug/metabolite transporter (DMT)-like permease